MPSIQPKHKASSTVSSHVTLGQPSRLLPIPHPQLLGRGVVLLKPSSEKLVCREVSYVTRFHSHLGPCPKPRLLTAKVSRQDAREASGLVRSSAVLGALVG